MKKILSVLLCAAVLCSAAGCASGTKNDTKSQTETTKAVQEATAATAKPDASSELKETIKAHDFEGVIYAVKNGKPVASYAKGKLENGEKITLSTPMPVGSVSKQFCAAAIMLLQEQGKLSVKDTLDKYYPEYKQGRKITLHNLLSMRSGLPDLNEENGSFVTEDKTEKENTDAIKKWVFSQPLLFKPDGAFAYTNINYALLADIVEQTSKKSYVDFLRENFFEPLGMKHTGSISELADSPKWAGGITYKKVDLQPGLTKGCGDLISNAADITAWINALSSSKVISAKSYKAMTTDYSPDEHYGYGLFLELMGGVGHYGNIQIYSSFDYVNKDEKMTLALFSNTAEPTAISTLAGDVLTDLLEN